MNIFGTIGTDFLYGTSGSDMIVGLDGVDFLYGGDGEDMLIGGAGADHLFGNSAYSLGTDRDMACYWDSPEGVYVDLTTGRGSWGTAQGDILVGIESLRGSEYADQLIGNELDNVLDGGGGEDWLRDGAGNDELVGGFGDDLLEGGSGADILNGGPGSDTAAYSMALAGVWASLLFGGITGDAAGDTYMSIERLAGSDFADYLQGNNDDNWLRGLRGNDWLWGEGGNDHLVGGRGIDMLVGGAGADTFIWETNTDTGPTLEYADTIADFDPALDLIDLQLVDADRAVDGNQAFKFIGTDDFTGPGQVNWFTDGSDTIVQMNFDADLAADAVIRISGVHLMASSYFLM
jgi:serralysin